MNHLIHVSTDEKEKFSKNEPFFHLKSTNGCIYTSDDFCFYFQNKMCCRSKSMLPSLYCFSFKGNEGDKINS